MSTIIPSALWPMAEMPRLVPWAMSVASSTVRDGVVRPEATKRFHKPAPTIDVAKQMFNTHAPQYPKQPDRLEELESTEQLRRLFKSLLGRDRM